MTFRPSFLLQSYQQIIVYTHYKLNATKHMKQSTFTRYSKTQAVFLMFLCSESSIGSGIPMQDSENSVFFSVEEFIKTMWNNFMKEKSKKNFGKKTIWKNYENNLWKHKGKNWSARNFSLQKTDNFLLLFLSKDNT